MEKLLAGYVISTHSLNGALKVKIITDFPFIRFVKGASVFIDEKEYRISNARIDGELVFIKFDGLNSINDVEHLVKKEVLVEKKYSDLKKDEYFLDDLKKCLVYDEQKNLIGEIFKIEDYPAQRTLRIKRENNKDVLIPFVDAFIKKIDISKNEIIVHLIEGML